MDQIGTDTRIRVHGGGKLPGEVRLPELEDIAPARDPFLDRVGRMLGEHPVSIGAATLTGALLAVRPSAGLFARSLRGIGGAAAGFVGATLIGSALSSRLGSGRSNTTAHVGDGAAVSHVVEDGPEQVRVMSWNVRALDGHDGNASTERALADIAETIEREQPDVLLLQEIGRGSWLGGDGDDLAAVAERLGATSAVLVPNGTFPNGQQKGQAVLTFGDAKVQDARGIRHLDPHGSGLLREFAATIGFARDSGVPLMPDFGPGHHPRTSADVMVTTAAGTAVRLLNVHLSGTGGPATGGTPDSTEAMEQQLVPLAATIDAWDGPTLMAGDFNVNGDTEFQRFEAGVLRRAGMRDAFAQVGLEPGEAATLSYPSTEAVRNIDRMYSSGELDVRRVRVLRDHTTQVASDHLPLVADIVVG